MVYQEDNNSCGNACVRNILLLITKDKSYSNYYIDNKCDNFAKIKNELAKNNIFYEGYKIENLSTIKKENLPAIIQIYNGSKYHFIVLLSIKKNKAKIFDPQFGDIILKLDDLKFISTGRILLFNSSTKGYIKNKTLQFIPLVIRLQYYILSIFQIFSLLLFFNSIVCNEKFVFKFIYGLISGSVILVHNLLNISTKKYLNKILNLYSIDSDNKDDITSLSKVLNNELSIISTTISYIVTFLVCLFILSYNPYEEIVILFPILSFIIKTYLTPLINNNKRKNFYFEDIAFTHLKTDKKRYFSFLDKAQKSAYKIIILSIIPYIILFSLLGLYMLLNFLFNPSFNTNRIFFYFFISFFIYSCLNKIQSIINKKNDTYIELNKMKMSIKSFSLKNKIIYYNNSVDNKGVNYE